MTISREKLLEVLVLAVISVFFLSLSLYQIELPGLYGDEVDKLVPTVGLLTGQDFPVLGWYKNILGFPVLLTFTDQIGPVL